EREKVLNAFKKSVLRNGRPVEENLLGKKLMALDDYRLVRVEILYRRPIILELFIGPRRETIYKSL
ncbi:MAG TPA: hypothetical protein VFK07_01125, partial [Candidatus Paceibacterota bacterium]|nr:hypothetical protein [Candidatus Paceibacterota bacterium]